MYIPLCDDSTDTNYFSKTETLQQNCFVHRDIPQPVTTKLLKKIECLDYEAITFDVYKSGVFTCCVLQGKVRSFSILLPVLSESANLYLNVT